MLYLIFCDGQLRSVSTDATDARTQMHELKKYEGYQCVRVVAVHGQIHDEVYETDDPEIDA